jgi:hypothetical protein
MATQDKTQAHSSACKDTGRFSGQNKDRRDPVRTNDLDYFDAAALAHRRGS